MKILNKITKSRLEDIKVKKELIPLKKLEQSIYFNSETVSLEKYLLRDDKVGIIAEIKKQSPLKGILNKYLSIERTSIGYMQAGASALSILTEPRYFNGCNEDLSVARKYNFCPLLRKDFIVDEYQIIESKSIGADAVLLIANCLTFKQLLSFSGLAHELGMEVLIEAHNEHELDLALKIDNALIGINNRNLETFTVDFKNAERLHHLIPGDRITVTESGIQTPEQVINLKNIGFNGFLIGGQFMMHDRPEKACKIFIDHLKNQQMANPIGHE